MLRDQISEATSSQVLRYVIQLVWRLRGLRPPADRSRGRRHLVRPSRSCRRATTTRSRASGATRARCSPGCTSSFPSSSASARKMNMMEQVIDVPSQDVITKDNAMVTRRRRRLLPGAGCRARRPTRSTSCESAIINLTMTNIRTVMGSMDLDELLSNRDEINARLLQVVDAATEPGASRSRASRSRTSRRRATWSTAWRGR